MAKSEAQKQKKLAKKRTKEIARRKKEAQLKNRMESFDGQLEAASKGDVVHCSISEEIAKVGMGSVIIVRRVDASRNMIGRWLIDVALLGARNAMFEVIPVGAMSIFRERMIDKSPEAIRDASPGDAKKLVITAIEFAREHGFKPHPDAVRILPLLDGIEASDREFEMGIDGEPTYIPGPDDSMIEVIEMQQRVRRKGGIRFGRSDVTAEMDDYAALDDPELDVGIDEDAVFDADAVFDEDAGTDAAARDGDVLEGKVVASRTEDDPANP